MIARLCLRPQASGFRIYRVQIGEVMQIFMRDQGHDLKDSNIRSVSEISRWVSDRCIIELQKRTKSAGCDVAALDRAASAQMGLRKAVCPCDVSFDLLDLRAELARIGLERRKCDASDRMLLKMLYDSKWEKKTATQDVYTISGLKAWLRRYDPAAVYNFRHSDNCLLARYFKAHGIADRNVWYALSPNTRMPEQFYNAARGEPWTYGDALERLNACRINLYSHDDGSRVHEDCACR